MFWDCYDADYEEMERKKRRNIAIILFCALAFIVGTMIYTYNSGVDKEENIKLARSNVENMMQRRLELIPDLVKTVEAFSKHEEAVFEAVSNARVKLAECLNNGNVTQISEANNELSRQINQLIAIAEDYPDLTSGQQYVSLMDQLEGSVNRIAIAREDYNQAVNEYNRWLRKYPNIIYAKLLGFEVFETFEADKEAERTSMVHFGD